MKSQKETDSLINNDVDDPKTPHPWQQVRHVSWQIAAVLLFVVLGAGQAISVRASLNDRGVLPYDTSAAVSLSELMKLVFCMTWVGIFNRREVPIAIPRTWVSESLDLFGVALLFAIQNEVNFLVIELLGAALFMILGNLKIVFTCIFMTLLLGKQFQMLQWFAVCLLALSAIVVKVPSIMAMLGNEDENDQSMSHSSLILGFGLVLVSTMSSGLASVVNELILKRGHTVGEDPQMPFMLKNSVLYAWGLLFNLGSWTVFGEYSFSACFTGMGFSSICCLAGTGLACAVILRYLDNVVRCFSGVAMVLVTVLISQMLPARLQEGSFDLYYMCALVLLAVSLVMYQAHDSPSLHFYILIAIACGMSTGFLCFQIERG